MSCLACDRSSGYMLGLIINMKSVIITICLDRS